MAWARIDDKFFSHPKVRSAGKDAALLYLASLCHCNSFVTEGFVSNDMLSLVGAQAFQRNYKASAARLVECGLWHKTEGGYLINDFLKYNYSRKQIDEIKEKRSESGKQGGRPPKPKPEDLESKLEANDKQNESKTKANQNQSESHTHTHTHNHAHNPLKEAAAAGSNSENHDLYLDYERGFGTISESVKRRIDKAVGEYSHAWVKDAIAEGVRCEASYFGYCEKILSTWKENGRNDGKKRKAAGSLEDFRKLTQSANGTGAK